MDAQDFIINHGSGRKAVEDVREHFPQLDAVPPLALIVESVNTVDGGTFVVATQEEEVLGVFDLVGEGTYGTLNALLSSVDVVAEEEVVGLGRKATILEEAEHVGKLAVHVTNNFEGSRKLQ